jgi:ATP-binding cassette subfamily B protein
MRALGFLRPAWKTAALAVVLTLITSLSNSIEPMVQKIAIDALTSKIDSVVQGLTQHQIINVVVIVLAVLTIFRGGSGVWSSVLTGRLKLLSNRTMVDKAVRNIYSQSLSHHRGARTGEVMSKLEAGVNGFSSALSDIMISLLPNLLQLLCTLAFMLSMNLKMTLIVFVCAPLSALVSVMSGKLSAARQKKVLQGNADNSAHFQEVLTLAKTVKSFNQETAEHQAFIKQYDSVSALIMKGFVLDAVLAFVKNRIMDIARLAVLWYGFQLALDGQITVGTLVAFLGYASAIFGPMLGLMNASETLRTAKVFCDAVYEIIDAPLSVVDRKDAQTIASVQGTLELDAVTFGYKPDRPVLKSLSLKIEPGTLVALVGASGSGKTTIVDLINRFYDPQEGRILLDGIDLRDIKQESLRSHIGMVLQDTGLFNTTIANNIAYSHPDATQEQIEQAAKAAAADLFITRRPDRYDTIVGEQGGNLSAGERQRVAIARAMLKNPQIYIFDEASSNLDAESEELISGIIDELARTKTVIVIAHRLSTVRHADKIVVLGEGVVQEEGTHDQLVAKRGQYHKLLMAQASCADCPDPCSGS